MMYVLNDIVRIKNMEALNNIPNIDIPEYYSLLIEESGNIVRVVDIYGELYDLEVIEDKFIFELTEEFIEERIL